MASVDSIDKKIISLLLKDARMKMTEIAKMCGISSTAVKNRINNLKKRGVILKETWAVRMEAFGFALPATIRVSLRPEAEKKVISLVQQQLMVMGIDNFLGSSEMWIFAHTRSIEELKRVEQLIMGEKGVTKIQVNIWNREKMYFMYDTFLEKLEAGV